MLITNQNLTNLRTGFSTIVADAMAKMKAESAYAKVTTYVPSTDKEETYGFLRDLPGMREWAGPRLINGLAEDGFKIKNKPFEETISVGRYDILYDKLGTYAPRFAMLGRAAAEQPDLMLWALAKSGFTTNCFDGQYFFDTDHPIKLADGTMGTYANTDGGAGAPWMLIDNSKGMMPFIYQEAIAPTFVSKDKPDDDNVFMQNEFLYGVDMYCQVGFGMPQLAWGSKQTLDATSYGAARAAMGNFKRDGGQPAGITGKILVVGPSGESAGRKILNSEYGAGGATNEWKDTAELMVVPWFS